MSEKKEWEIRMDRIEALMAESAARHDKEAAELRLFISGLGKIVGLSLDLNYEGPRETVPEEG